MIKIKKIFALEFLDSRGIPTIKAHAESLNGIKAEASVPSGSSAGKFESMELRDGGKRYLGKGVLKAVANVNNVIFPRLKGKGFKNQKDIDETLIELDGTPNKSKLGANAILSVSLAVAKLSSESEKMPLYEYLNQSFFSDTKPSLPIPFSVVVEGGKHSSNNLDIQEFIIAPVGISTFEEKFRAVSEIYHTLGENLLKRNQGTNVGLEGAYGPDLNTNTEAMDLIVNAISGADYSGKVKLALDIAASELYHKDEESYYLKSEEVTLKRQQLLGLYNEWCVNYPIISIEDGLEQEDWEGWVDMTEKLSAKGILSVGDDLFVTDPQRIKKGIAKKAANAAIIKPNQIGTLTETVEAINLAIKGDMEYIISHRGGDTIDTFIADLAVASAAHYIKAGAPCRGERVEKYNRLLEIEQELKVK